MKHSRIHIAHGFFLLLLAVSILLSSVGLYAASEVSSKEIATKTKSQSSAGQSQKEEKVSASPNFEAVVVSLISHDFAKEILFCSFDFSPVLEKVVLAPKRYIVSEKYFRTLFTHFISPNAP